MRIRSWSASIAIRAPARCRRSCIFCSQRAQQLAALKQQDLFAPLRVADYLIDKDRLFARATLDEEEYRLYEQVYAQAGDRCAAGPIW